MAFGRKWLDEVLSNEELTAKEKAQKIMDEHINVTDALKDDRDKYKGEAEKAADLQKQLDGMTGGEDWKKKYEDEKKAFEDFKKQTAQQAEVAKVKAAYRKLLQEEKVSESVLDDIEKITDYSGMKLDKDGNLADVETLKNAIGEKYGRFRTTVIERGAEVAKPPQTGASKPTKADILAIKDTTERQKAIAENLDLFQKG